MSMLQGVTRYHWVEFGVRGAVWCAILAITITGMGLEYGTSAARSFIEVPIGITALQTVLELLRPLLHAIWPQKVRVATPNLPLLWSAAAFAGVSIGAALGAITLSVVS